MRFLITLFWLGLMAMPAAQAASAPPGWMGVWQGTVGQADVRLCLQGHDSGTIGAYYDTQRLTVITLQQPGQRDPAAQTLVLHEPLGLEPGAPPKAETAAWTLQLGSHGQTLGGIWHGRGKDVPISLMRMPKPASAEAQDSADTQACGSEAFYKPLEVPPRVVASKVKLKGRGTAYRALTLDDGGHLGAEVQSFELMRQGPGARRFNEAQGKEFSSHQVEAMGCITGVLESYAQLGDYHVLIEPVWMGRHWLVKHAHGGSECGGAHPNAFVQYEIWNLDEGTRADPWTWFNAKGVQIETHGRGEHAYRTVQMGSDLLTALARQWPRNDDDCKTVVEGAGAGWMPYPTRQGMVFVPSLPHVIFACTEEVTLSWPQMALLLNAQGRKVLRSIRADMAHPPSR